MLPAARGATSEGTDIDRRNALTVRARAARVLAVAAAALILVLPAAPAAAHSYSATVYADVTEPEPGLVHTVLDLEYVLLATDGARAMDAADFERDAYEDVQASGQDPTALTTRVLEKHSDAVDGYVLPRFTIAVETAGESEVCPSATVEPYAITFYDEVPHARMVIDADCRDLVGAEPATYRVTTALFPGTSAGGMTTTIVTYDLDAGSGVANLDTDASPTMTTSQDWGSRMGEFFLLGAEHLLSGLDHILFLLVLIVGSRRLRDIVLAATAFTVAHSVTFILAALGVVSVPAFIVEPIIALSIAVVALWDVWELRHDRTRPVVFSTAVDDAISRPGTSGHTGRTAVLERPAVDVLSTPAQASTVLGLRRADVLRIGVVFLFGLVHGVGFAGALGIDEPFSWGLLGALLVFNVGIEVVQLTIIAIVFPLLFLLRRRMPDVAFWLSMAVASAVAVVGLFWFVERLIAGG